MAVARHVAICPPMDTCLSLIEEAMKQQEFSQPVPHLPCSPAKGNPAGLEAWRERLDCERAEDKQKLMSSLGLVQTGIFPRIRALMEWRRRRRQRRQRQCKLGSSSTKHPSNAVTVSLPICNPDNTDLNKKPDKEISVVSEEEATSTLEKKVRKKPKNIQTQTLQSDSSTRGRGVKPEVTTGSTGKRSQKTGGRVTPPSKRAAKTVEVVHTKKSQSGRSSMRRSAKAKPAGEATAVTTEEEQRVDAFLMPSPAQAEELPPRRVLRTRRPAITPPVRRSNEKRHHVTKSTELEATRPKRTKTIPRCTMPDLAGQPQVQQLREPRSQTAKVSKASHTCLQCEASYEACDTLTMHRLKHIKENPWSCPFCSKTCLRLRNVRSHVRTHQPELYKCKNCIVAAEVVSSCEENLPEVRPKTRHLDMGSTLDTRFASKVKQEMKEEELDSARAQEKDRLTNVLGLVKTVLLPRLGGLIGWGQKNRLRKPKPANHSLITPSALHSSVPELPSHPGALERVPPSTRSLRSKVVTPDPLLPSSGVRRSSRTSQGRGQTSEAELRRTREQVHRPVHQSVHRIKTEQVEPTPVSPQGSDPPQQNRAKRQRRPPNKLCDSGFLFSVGPPAGGATAVIKKEEDVDIRLTPSDSFTLQRTLRSRRPSATVVKREREERSVSRNPEERLRHKSQKTSRGLARSTGGGGSKRLPRPQNQSPRTQNVSHSCLQCEASYQDCDALVMHRLRHIQGKHWPCPLCCKKFYRMRNVRSHIRTHEPELYKCRSCISAGL